MTWTEDLFGKPGLPRDEESPFAKERRERREALTAAGFDGPHSLSSDTLSIFSTRNEYAICLACGSMVSLGDMMPNPQDVSQSIERGIYLHSGWHLTLNVKA